MVQTNSYLWGWFWPSLIWCQIGCDWCIVIDGLCSFNDTTRAECTARAKSSSTVNYAAASEVTVASKYTIGSKYTTASKVASAWEPTPRWKYTATCIITPISELIREHSVVSSANQRVELAIGGHLGAYLHHSGPDWVRCHMLIRSLCDLTGGILRLGLHVGQHPVDGRRCLSYHQQWHYETNID